MGAFPIPILREGPGSGPATTSCRSGRRHTSASSLPHVRRRCLRILRILRKKIFTALFPGGYAAAKLCNLSRFAGVSEAGARRRNPDSSGSCRFVEAPELVEGNGVEGWPSRVPGSAPPYRAVREVHDALPESNTAAEYNERVARGGACVAEEKAVNAEGDPSTSLGIGNRPRLTEASKAAG